MTFETWVREQGYTLVLTTIAAHLGRSAPDEGLKGHHRKLIEDCEQAMKQLAELIRIGYLDVPLN
jgi:hypothetical protein